MLKHTIRNRSGIIPFPGTARERDKQNHLV